jgi:hypothetical protein
MPAKSVQFRRAVSYAVLVALLGALSVTLSQCTMVGERLTGPTLQRVTPTTCVGHCKDLYDNLFALERKRHLAEIEICAVLSGPERQECLVRENVRHQAATDQLTQGKLDCLQACSRPRAGG